MKRMTRYLGALLLAMSAGSTVHAAAVDGLQAGYRDAGAGPFSAAAGEQLWHSSSTHAGDKRSCTSCHGENLRQKGKHATTGKVIEPMAPSVNPTRLSDAAKIEKWFRRNCNWTLGRECTAQEKGDLLEYLRRQ